MPIPTVGLEEGRKTLPQLAARAHMGQPCLLTRHGKPYAAIVSAEALGRAGPRVNFLGLRGSGRGLWGKLPARVVADLRNEWG